MILAKAAVAFPFALCLGCGHLARKANIAYMTVATAVLPHGLQTRLKRSFIETYKHRVTIEVSFTVDATSPKPNPKLFDGDLHFSGRAPEVGLRLVAEIINAGQADSAVAVVQRASAAHSVLKLTGAWRLWPEHAIGTQIQGRPSLPLTNANPDHIFEIHPVTRLGDLSLLDSFEPVEAYKPGNASRTFGIFEKAECTIKANATTVTLLTPVGLYNDIHFLMESTGDSHQVVSDGRFLTARALDLDGKPLVERVRLVLVKGTAPERKIQELARGDRLHIWALPRVDLAEVSRRVAGSRTDPSLLKGTLPYELVVLGTYQDAK